MVAAITPRPARNPNTRRGQGAKILNRKRIYTEQQIWDRARDGLTLKPRKNLWLKMAVGWEWPYIGKTCSDLFPRCSNKVRFTIGQQLFEAAIATKTRGRNDDSPPVLPSPSILYAWRKMAYRFCRFDEEKIFFHRRVSTVRKTSVAFSRSFKIGRDCFLEWWEILVGDILTGSMADRRAHRFRAIWRPFHFFSARIFWIIWIVCFLLNNRDC